MTFNDLKFTYRNSMGIQAEIQFPNGYGASIIRGAHSYGGKSSLYELAVLKDGALCYTTPITNDVEGWLTEEIVTELLQRIETL